MKYKTHCECGKKLLVPTWKKCQKCTKVVNLNYFDLQLNEVIRDKRINKSPFYYNGGYKIEIPLVKFHFAKEVLLDGKTVIGWKSF